MCRKSLAGCAYLLLLVCLLMGQGCPQGTEGDNNNHDDNGNGNNGSGSETTTGAQALFDQAWKDFDGNYSYFVVKGIDWDALKTQYRPAFASDMSADAFADKLVEVLKNLSDWHVYVTRADGEVLGTDDQEIVINYTSTPRNRYVTDGYQTLGDNVIWHGWFNNWIGYIRVDTLDTSAWQNITEQDIEDMFKIYQAGVALIIDIRPNSGGNENNAMMIASRLIDNAVTYGYVENRNGPNHDDFDAAIVKTLSPSDGSKFTHGPVICLIGQRCMSSAEWFALMLRAAGATLIGDTTRGASGNPQEYGPLSNGVKYTISSWVAYAADANGQKGAVIEDNGISPDYAVDPQNSFDSEHDFVIEKALEVLDEMFIDDRGDPDGDDQNGDNDIDQDCLDACLLDCDPGDDLCEEICYEICDNF